MCVKPKIITLTIIIDPNPHRLYEMPDVCWMGKKRMPISCTEMHK